jgi:4-carboxymuconolactone decarboxylase
MESSARIPPLTPPFSSEVEHELARIMPGKGGFPPLAIFRLLTRDLKLARASQPLGRFFLGHHEGETSDIAPRDREIVIDRVCARCGCEYEWGVHVTAFGKGVGLSEAQVAASVLGDAQDPAWSERDSLLIALVDVLHDTGHVPDELWARLSAEWSQDQLLELLILSGWYHAISYLLNATRTQLEPWAARFPQRPLQRRQEAVGSVP